MNLLKLLEDPDNRAFLYFARSAYNASVAAPFWAMASFVVIYVVQFFANQMTDPPALADPLANASMQQSAALFQWTLSWPGPSIWGTMVQVLVDAMLASVALAIVISAAFIVLMAYRLYKDRRHDISVELRVIDEAFRLSTRALMACAACATGCIAVLLGVMVMPPHLEGYYLAVSLAVLVPTIASFAARNMWPENLFKYAKEANL